MEKSLRKSLFPKEQALETDVIMDSIPANVLEAVAVAKGSKKAYKNKKKISAKMKKLMKKLAMKVPPIAAGAALTKGAMKEMESEDFLNKIMTK